jgi:hypothetical protein
LPFTSPSPLTISAYSPCLVAYQTAAFSLS